MIDREMNLAQNTKHLLTLQLATTLEQSIQQGFIVELALFFIRYSFLLEQSANAQNSCASKTPQFQASQGKIYMGARYLAPSTFSGEK